MNGEPISLRVLRAIQTRIEQIDGSGAYTNDVQNRVYIGQRSVSESDTFPLIAIHGLTESAGASSGGGSANGGTNAILVTHTIDVEAYFNAVPNDWGIDAELMKADLKRALLSMQALVDDGLNLGLLAYESSELLPPDGSLNFAGVKLTLSATHTEKVGDPTATK